jgi:hypothetical protein
MPLSTPFGSRRLSANGYRSSHGFKRLGVANRELIEITTRSKTLSDAEGVRIEINDSGDGVPEEVRD